MTKGDGRCLSVGNADHFNFWTRDRSGFRRRLGCRFWCGCRCGLRLGYGGRLGTGRMTWSSRGLWGTIYRRLGAWRNADFEDRPWLSRTRANGTGTGDRLSISELIWLSYFAGIPISFQIKVPTVVLQHAWRIFTISVPVT